MTFWAAFYLVGLCLLLGPLCPRRLAAAHLDAVSRWIWETE